MNKTDFGIRDKIKDIESLAIAVQEARSKGKKVVHCHGVFDLLHIGHIRHFEQAKEFGDVLIVTTTPDQWATFLPLSERQSQTLRVK